MKTQKIIKDLKVCFVGQKQTKKGDTYDFFVGYFNETENSFVRHYFPNVRFDAKKFAVKEWVCLKNAVLDINDYSIDNKILRVYTLTDASIK